MQKVLGAIFQPRLFNRDKTVLNRYMVEKCRHTFGEGGRQWLSDGQAIATEDLKVLFAPGFYFLSQSGLGSRSQPGPAMPSK